MERPLTLAEDVDAFEPRRCLLKADGSELLLPPALPAGGVGDPDERCRSCLNIQPVLSVCVCCGGVLMSVTSRSERGKKREGEEKEPKKRINTTRTMSWSCCPFSYRGTRQCEGGEE